MNLDFIRRHCLSFHHAAEEILWGNRIVFKSAAKCSPPLRSNPRPSAFPSNAARRSSPNRSSAPASFPAPYSARCHWVAPRHAGLPAAAVKRLLRSSYRLVFARLPRKTQAGWR
jgi:predicted DNA-binding protein (MmcQ/YjbR family)